MVRNLAKGFGLQYCGLKGFSDTGMFRPSGIVVAIIQPSLPFEVTKEEKYKLLFHNGFLKGQVPQKKLKHGTSGFSILYPSP